MKQPFDVMRIAEVSEHDGELHFLVEWAPTWVSRSALIGDAIKEAERLTVEKLGQGKWSDA